MKWTNWVFGSVAVAALMAGCGGGRQGNDAETGGGTETGTMQDDAGMTGDTAATMTTDTGAAAVGTDTAGGARLQRDTNNPATGADTGMQTPSDTARPSGDTSRTPSQ